MKALQQRVVKLSRDTRPLVDTLFQTHVEFVGELSHAQLMQRPQQRQAGERCSGTKPHRLVVGWCDREVQRRASLVPHTIVVGCRDTESILAGTQVAVKNLASSPRVMPLSIASFEGVSEPDLLRGGKAQRGVADFDVATPRGQANEPADGVVGAVGTNVLDIHRWRNSILPQPAGID